MSNLPLLVSPGAQVMNKPLASGAYVLNKVPVKRRLGAASGNQSDLSQTGAVVEDSQVCSWGSDHLCALG